MNYSMAQVIHLTGIQSHTLRVWERRYDFIKAKRKESKFRYYTEEQLKLLVNTSILLKNGFRISQISAMDKNVLHENVDMLLKSKTESPTERVKGLFLAMIEINEALFDRIYSTCLNEIGLLRTFTEVIFPFFSLIGGLWTFNKANPYHEHFASNLIRQKLISGLNELELPKHDAPKIIMFLLEGDHHEISLLLANYIAKKMGWKVIYLGLRLPLQDLEVLITESKASLFLTTLTVSNPKEISKLSEIIHKHPSSKLLLAGKKEIAETIADEKQILFFKSPNDLTFYLDNTK